MPVAAPARPNAWMSLPKRSKVAGPAPESDTPTTSDGPPSATADKTQRAAFHFHGRNNTRRDRVVGQRHRAVQYRSAGLPREVAVAVGGNIERIRGNVVYD